MSQRYEAATTCPAVEVAATQPGGSPPLLAVASFALGAVVMAAILVTSVTCAYRIGRRMGRGAALHKMTQSPVTYKRKNARPRFTCLGEHDHGCWSE